MLIYYCTLVVFFSSVIYASETTLAGIEKFYETNTDRETLESSSEPVVSKSRLMRSRGIVIDEPLHPHEARKLAVKLSQVHHMAAKQSVNRPIHLPSLHSFSKSDSNTYSPLASESFSRERLPSPPSVISKQFIDSVHRPSPLDSYLAYESAIVERNAASVKNYLASPVKNSNPQDPQMVLVFAHSGSFLFLLTFYLFYFTYLNLLFTVEIPLLVTPPKRKQFYPMQAESSNNIDYTRPVARKYETYPVFARSGVPRVAEESRLDPQVWQAYEMIPYTRYTYYNEPSMSGEESRVSHQWHWPSKPFLPYQQVSRSDPWN